MGMEEEQRQQSFELGRRIGKIWDAYADQKDAYAVHTVLDEVCEELEGLDFVSTMSFKYGFETSHLKRKGPGKPFEGEE